MSAGRSPSSHMGASDGKERMDVQSDRKQFFIDHRKLPALYPTDSHSAEFWEALGRTVATYGFLEETLGKAIFAFTGMRSIPKEKADEELSKWLLKLQSALSDPLGNLIDAFGKAVRDHGGATVTNLDEIIEELRKISAIRNVLCHASWRSPDERGRSVPFFVDKRQQVFSTEVDVAYLQQAQRHVVELTCDVINTVTQMGWQFPGSNGPGKPIWTP